MIHKFTGLALPTQCETKVLTSQERGASITGAMSSPYHQPPNPFQNPGAISTINFYLINLFFAILRYTLLYQIVPAQPHTK